MTSLRFVGDLSLWMGLALALVVALLAWRYYRREAFDLSPRLRWTLPVLRATAFFLGIMILTGPVLHHRTTIGEPGRVKIYVDASQSMSLCDQHLSVGRKLLIAEQQGWLEAGRVDSSPLQSAEKLASVRQQVALQLEKADLTADSIQLLRDQLLTVVKGEPALQKLFDQLADANPATSLSAADQTSQLMDSCSAIEEHERQLLGNFDQQVQRLVDSGDRGIQSALAMFDQTPRFNRAERSLLDGDDGLFAQLRENHHVEVVALRDDRAVELLDGQSFDELPEQLQMQPDAGTSDLSTGVTATQKTKLGATSDAASADESDLAANAAQPNTAIVLLTDGRHNSGPSPLQTARILGGQGVAFYPVSLGSTQPAPDLAVVGLEHPEMVFRKDRVRGVVLVRDRMPAGQLLVAEIRHEDEVVWTEQLLTQNSGDRRIEFEFDAESLVEKIGGQFDDDVKQHAVPISLVASVAPLAGEAEVQNNQQTFRFAAITQSYRLLILDGRSRWETRYLRNVFERDSQWDVNVVIAGPGTDENVISRGEGQGQFPESRDELFIYDLMIVGEIDPELLTEHEYTWLREFVELRGGGMIFIDGQRSRMKGFTDQTLRPLLPVQWNEDVPVAVSTMLQLTDSGRRLPALNLEATEEANLRLWNELPSPATLNSVVAMPGAETLVEAVVDGQSQPFMVTRNYGSGRVLYLSTDETWRWRYKVADVYHQRIWNQLATWVMPRPFSTSDEYLSIDTGSVSYSVGDSAPIRIQLKGLDGRPATNSTVDALVWKQGRVVSTISLTEDPQVPGFYRGVSESLSDGDHEISIRASGFSQEALKARGRFAVRPPESGELEETNCNESLLRQMAAESGGTYLREEQSGQLVELLTPLSRGRIVESDTVLWQSYWWFVAMILLLCLEWFLRKRAGLL